MEKSEMISILRGKVVYVPLEQIQEQLNEIADFLEKAEPLDHCADCAKYHLQTGWCNEHSYFVDCYGEPCGPGDSEMWKDFDPDYYCKDFERMASANEQG